MNPDQNNDGLMYKAVGFAIFVVLVTLIILTTVSADTDRPSSQPDDTKGTASTSDETLDTDPIDSDKPIDSNTDDTVDTDPPPTTTAPSTEPPTTTKAPETTTQAPPKVENPVEVPKSFATDEILKYLAEHPDAVLGETEDAGEEYINKITFLGDSTTYGLRAYKMLEGGKQTTQVWTPTNGTLTLSAANTALIWYPETGKEIKIKDAAAAKQPEILVITLGVNGVSFMNEDYFKNEYGKLIDSIKDVSPDTKIILQSIFPVARNYELLDKINNQKIDSANKWICELADEKGVKYVDTNSALRDDEGWLPNNYQNGDGMHLQTNSFTIELNYLRTHAWVD